MMLANAGSGSQSASIILACTFLAVAAIVGAIAVIWIRRWLQDEDDVGPAGIFNLGDLRALHQQGKLSNEEFERMRAMIVDAAKKSPPRSDPTQNPKP